MEERKGKSSMIEYYDSLMRKKGWKEISSAPKDKQVTLAFWYVPSDASFDNGTRAHWHIAEGVFISDRVGWTGILNGRPSHWFDGTYFELEGAQS